MLSWCVLHTVAAILGHAATRVEGMSKDIYLPWCLVLSQQSMLPSKTYDKGFPVDLLLMEMSPKRDNRRPIGWWASKSIWWPNYYSWVTEKTAMVEAEEKLTDTGSVDVITATREGQQLMYMCRGSGKRSIWYKLAGGWSECRRRRNEWHRGCIFSQRRDGTYAV